MRTIFYIIFSLIFYALHSSNANQYLIDNPQVQMVGARHMALGMTNPIIEHDINGAFINPASIAGIQSMPLAISYKNVLDEYEYKLINLGIPFHLRFNIRKTNERLQHLNFGLSYGSSLFSGIPETFCESNNKDGSCKSIQDIDKPFSSGNQIGALTMGTQFYDFFGFNTFSVGFSFKYFRQFLTATDASYSQTMGVDTGLITSRMLNLWFLDTIHLGLSLHNIFAPPAKNSYTQNETLLPLSIYFGSKIDMFSDTLSLYINNGLSGLYFGAEYKLLENIILRGSSNLNIFRLGTGIIFNDIAIGFGQHNYSVRFDYTYEHPEFSFLAPTHMISFSILGDSRPNAPRILTPESELLITDKSIIDLAGIGPKNTTMRIFRNDAMIRTTASNKSGKWSSQQLELVPNKNLIYVQSYSLNKDISLESYPVMIYSDIIAPKMTPAIVFTSDTIKVLIDINEDVAEVNGQLGDEPLFFIKQNQNAPNNLIDAYMQPTHWTAEVPIPPDLAPNSAVKQNMPLLTLQSEDLAGNKTDLLETPVFLSILFPQDQYVHYKDSLRVIGKLSPLVDTLMINKNPIYIDQSRQFASPVDLTPGKNMINFNLTLKTNPKHNTLKSNKTVNYTMRVLYLKRYPDVTPKTKGRREIEFLSTLDILYGEDDGNFYPEKPLTRAYMTQLLVLMSNIDVPDTVTTLLFSDVAADYPYAKYIKVAIENGLIFAFPDGSFRPDQAITLSEALFLLSNAGLIELTESESTEDRYITRAELAEFLAYLPEYESQIEALINWETGYKLD
mgnify:CR=1 FL=1